METPTSPETTSVPAPPLPVRRAGGRRALPQTLTPTLWLLLFFTFFCVAVLGASGAYLSAVSLLEWFNKSRGASFSTTFTLWMFLSHGAVGIAIFVPFVVFAMWHMRKGLKINNPAAIRRGLWLTGIGMVIGVTGFALFQFDGLPQLPTGTISRSAVYWLHVVLPVMSIYVYVAHRRKGPNIRWRYAKMWAMGVVAFVGGMMVLHSQSPAKWFAIGPKDGDKYFHPSEARTADGKFIPVESLNSDTYCMQCHKEIYNDHLHSAHKFSSFNNPAYLSSVLETRKVALERDGNVKASRWCAGCHDPVPFFSGLFDDPTFDMEKHVTGHAGITCVACHAISEVHSTTGNAAYTIESPDHYPFAFSGSDTMRMLSNQIIKAKPDVHKKSFLKPLHKTAEFCSTCHKVSLPVELNHYKDFLRGQNHYDSFLLSGASGNGARSFYYPPKASANCSTCHMNLKPAGEPGENFAARDFDGSGIRKNHNHLFPAANTGLPTLLKNDPRYADRAEGFDKAIREHTDYLRGTDPDGKDKKLRIDLFAIKDGATTDAEKLIAPLRPNLPKLKPGQSYTVEVVIRTLNIGHHFSQGTVDSNEIWVDFQAKSGSKEIARSGALSGPNDTGELDKWAHMINVHMLDRNGNRINRRNPQDIFTPLYDHQIPPGAAVVVHYRLDVPKDVAAPIDLNVKLRYRKFDYEYMSIVHKGGEVPALPIVDICEDNVTLPVEGVAVDVPAQTSKIPAGWQRWNDYGIANLIEGGVGARKGHFRQAEAAFQKLLTLDAFDAVSHAHMNLARVYIDEGRLDDAARHLKLAGEAKAPWWTLSWLTAVVNSERATKEGLDAAIPDLEKIVSQGSHQPSDRGFDFTKDYIIQNLLANRLFKRREFEPDGSDSQRQYVLRAVASAQKVLALDSEDVQAHDLLRQAYGYLSGSGGPESTGTTEPNLIDLPVLAKQFADAKLLKPERMIFAARLIEGLDGLAKRAPQADQPKIATLRGILKEVRPAFDDKSDPEFTATTAALLSALHREFHLIYKPDEIARSTATRIYREKNPIANYAARDRVIYPTTPTHRETILGGGELSAK